MRIEMVHRFENKLLDRIEYIFKIYHEGEGSPKRITLRERLSEQLGIDKELVIIKKIKTPFGLNISYAEVHVYDSKEFLTQIEPKYILKRNGIL